MNFLEEKKVKKILKNKKIYFVNDNRINFYDEDLDINIYFDISDINKLIIKNKKFELRYSFLAVVNIFIYKKNINIPNINKYLKFLDIEDIYLELNLLNDDDNQNIYIDKKNKSRFIIQKKDQNKKISNIECFHLCIENKIINSVNIYSKILSFENKFFKINKPIYCEVLILKKMLVKYIPLINEETFPCLRILISMSKIRKKKNRELIYNEFERLEIIKLSDIDEENFYKDKDFYEKIIYYNDYKFNNINYKKV